MDFGESSKKIRRERENSLNSKAGNSPIRFHHKRSRTRGRERHDDRNVFNRMSHRKKSVHERLSDTYSPSITKSGPSRASSRDLSHSRGHSLNRDRPRIRDRLPGLEESYDDTYSSHRIRIRDRLPGLEESYDDTYSSHGTRTKYRDRSQSSTSNRGHWKSKAKRRKPADEEDLAVPWTCEDVDLFTPRIRNFKSSRKTRMPNNVKTYDGTGDPEDHLKIFQAATQFDELPPESIDGYKGLKAAFLAYYMQQNKCVKDQVEIHNIKQRDEETIEEFIESFKIETGRMKGAPECMRISEFMHGVNNPELTKRLNEHVPKTVEEMMTATTAFIHGETVVASKKKVHTPWKSQDQSKRHTSERRSDFQNPPKDGRGSNKFTPLTRTSKEIFAAESGKFKPPPLMVTPVEKRSSNKFCEFYNDKGHSTDECVQLRKQIEELVRVGKLSHFIKEIRLDKDQQKTGKKDAPVKDKAAAIYMIQSWQRVTRYKVTQSFAHVQEITFPPLTANKGTKGLLVIEAEIDGHVVHRMYVDGGSSMELRILVTIGDANHSTKAWMDFMIVRSLSPYNGIIGRPEIREIQAVPSTAHGMLKFSANGGIVIIRMAIHPDFPDQEITIGGTVSTKARTELCTLLKGNLDIFAWQSSDMTGVPRSIGEHQLNIREGYPPIRQKKRAKPRSTPRQSK
ncbi:reverse transcriptase domain-containing protein [Tanacetum coccineum]